ncbi:hypothetical protein K525DRAFT_277485 [Schizophyllum commune Loenen D]|nr:hypothetical protein K525DRAFT_277485 [Schizophyllum commune Loenen D]
MRDDRPLFNVDSPVAHHLHVFVDIDKCKPANPVLESQSSRGLLPPTISPGTDINFAVPGLFFGLFAFRTYLLIIPRMSGNDRLSSALSSLKASRSSRPLLSADLQECVLGNIAPLPAQEGTIRRLIEATQNQLQSIGPNAPHEKNTLSALQGLLSMALSSPIRKLPQELVDAIVYCARESTRDDSPRAAFRLAHVCRQWRGDARLWTRLRLAGNQVCGAEALLQVRAWFERARALHVSLTVVCTDEGCEPGSEHLLMEPRFGDLGPQIGELNVEGPP